MAIVGSLDLLLCPEALRLHALASPDRGRSHSRSSGLPQRWQLWQRQREQQQQGRWQG
jgi:hypothetical protein